jgi:hypothetical protein
MDNEMSKRQREFENAADVTGFCFAGAVLCAVLAAGVIVYRTANADIRTASNDIVPAAAQADSMAPILRR